VSEPAVSISAVSMTFEADGGSVHALDNISIDVRDGEFLSLIGPSGCGKSTLLRLVGDLLVPSTGEVAVRGKSARQARLDREYGMVFQSSTLLEWRKVAANVELPLEIMGVSPEQRANRAREMLALVDISGFEDNYPWQMSGGMQQRV